MIKIFSWRPTPATFIAGILVLSGFILMNFDEKFLYVVAVATFGPGILRELGWLKDQDEFQRKAAWRAGYHAFLIVGLITFLQVTHMRTSGNSMGDPVQVITFLLVLLWFTWLFSSLLAYWGPRKTVSIILYAFGIVWLLFIIISNLTNPLSMLLHAIFTLPFFLLALLSRKWPRITGVCLLIAAGFFFYRFGLYKIFGDQPFERGRGAVIVFFLGPLAGSGIALLCKDNAATDEQDEKK